MKNLRITILFFASTMGIFLLLAVRCFYLQSLKSRHYRSVSLKQQQKRITQKPQRGAILDSRGRVLAASNKIQTVFAEPRIINDPKAVSNKLASILDMPAHEICIKITESKNPGFAKIKVGADPNQCRGAARIYGLGVQSDWQRYYPVGTLTAHLVGFTSADNRGLGGIELQFDKLLSGSSGQNIFLADAFPSRRPVRLKQQQSLLTDGSGIILTIDSSIQQFTRAELLKQYQAYHAESAVAIVAEPQTGAVLAMVCLPDFDPNHIASTDTANFRNRAITDQFEPGSLLKPFAAAIAVDSGTVSLKEKIFCENGNYRGKGFGQIGEYGNHKFANLTVRDILVNSSNIGMAKIGQRLGAEKLHKGLTHFGFGKKTGIELPGEVDGLLHPPEKWNGYSVTRVPFGQEISVTALQLVRAFCILANRGRSVQPFLVKAVVDNNGHLVKLKRPPPPIGFVLKPEIAHWIVNDALTGVVNEGTGKREKLEKWQAFGKTGTANIPNADRKGYSDTDYVASFLAGAPADDPAVVVLVSIRKPDIKLGKGYTGGTVAAPVAAEILEKTLNYLEKQQI